jgi:hypothetical protein
MIKFLVTLGSVLSIAVAVGLSFGLGGRCSGAWQPILILFLPLIICLGVFCENVILRVMSKWISVLFILYFLFLITKLINKYEYFVSGPVGHQFFFFSALLATFLVGLGAFDSSITFFCRGVRREEGLISLWLRAKKSQLRKQIKDNEREDKKL